jgi:hypothetical protein
MNITPHGSIKQTTIQQTTIPPKNRTKNRQKINKMSFLRDY